MKQHLFVSFGGGRRGAQIAVSLAVDDVADREFELGIAVVHLRGGGSAIQQFGLQQSALSDDLNLLVCEEYG